MLHLTKEWFHGYWLVAETLLCVEILLWIGHCFAEIKFARYDMHGQLVFLLRRSASGFEMNIFQSHLRTLSYRSMAYGKSENVCTLHTCTVHISSSVVLTKDRVKTHYILYCYVRAGWEFVAHRISDISVERNFISKRHFCFPLSVISHTALKYIALAE